MPEKRTIKKAQTAKRQGKSASTQAAPFVHEAIEHIRKGKHGAKNTKQAIAIGLSEARRSGVGVPDKSEKTSPTKKAVTRKAPLIKKTAARKATPASSKSHIAARKVSPTKSKAATKRLQGEPTSTVSHAALSRHAKKTTLARSKADLHASALKGTRTRAKHT